MANDLETKVRKTNTKYKLKKLALIQKIEVPLLYTTTGVQPVMSTVDFIGCYSPDGRGVAFDAKETEKKTSFPLANIKQHQLLFLEIFEQVGGHAFFLIHFKKVHKDKAYVTPIEVVGSYMHDENARKSIPLTEFKDEWLVDITDYLGLCDEPDVL